MQAFTGCAHSTWQSPDTSMMARNADASQQACAAWQTHPIYEPSKLCVCSLQSFLVKSEAAFKQHPVWANVTPAHQAQAVEV